jgi:signal transduction histidine kinase
VPDTLWFVDIDEGQMSQVIHNLIINADQAMPNGGTISVRCENVTLPATEGPALSDGNYVKIVIQDQGIGIPHEDLVNIFDPNFTTKQRGTGLGLATSYSIIQKHGGCIFAESELNAGATFYMVGLGNKDRGEGWGI